MKFRFKLNKIAKPFNATIFKNQTTIPIIAYLTVQNLLITTLVGGFATGFYYNYSGSASQQSVEHGLETIRNFTTMQQGYVCNDIYIHFNIYVGQPILTLQSSANLFSTGFMDLGDWSQLRRWFFPQIQAFPMISSISYSEYPSSDVFGIKSYTEGDSMKYNLQVANTNSNRICPPEISVNEFCNTTTGTIMISYPTTKDGVIDFSGVTNNTSSLLFGPPDPTDMGWYIMVEAPRNKITWYPTVSVVDAEKGILGIPFVYPLWAANETFYGAFVGEMGFLDMNDLLSKLHDEATENTIIYVFQRDEVMLGTTTNDSIVQYDPVLGTSSVKKLADMTDPFIQFSQKQLRSKYRNSFSSIPRDTALNTKAIDPSTGITYIIQFAAISPGDNLDWLVVVGAPEDDYTHEMISVQNTIFEQLQDNNRNVVILLFSFQFLLMLGIMFFLWFRVVNPLRTLVSGLNKASDFDFTTISEGTFVTSPSNLSEVYQCERAFFDMTTKFAKAFKQNRSMMQRQERQGMLTSTSRTAENLVIEDTSSSHLPPPVPHL